MLRISSLKLASATEGQEKLGEHNGIRNNEFKFSHVLLYYCAILRHQSLAQINRYNLIKNFLQTRILV